MSILVGDTISRTVAPGPSSSLPSNQDTAGIQQKRPAADTDLPASTAFSPSFARCTSQAT
jgi:hypothetical protein